MGRPKAAVGAIRPSSTVMEPRRTPAKAAVQAADVVGSGGAILKILNQSPGGIADNVRESRTGAPGAPRFIGFETTFLVH